VKHSNLTGASIHVPHRWEYADATAREAATGFVPSDVGKLALQLDSGAYWRLTDDDPITWTPLTGAATNTDIYANRPTAGNAGNLFLPSDGFVIERDDGAAWASWGPIYRLTKPVLSEFAWVNQSTATATEAGGGIYLLAPAVSGDQLRVLKKAAPGTPYVVTACFLHHNHQVNYNQCGLVFRQSSDGKIVSYAIHGEGASWKVTKWNSHSSYSGVYLTQAALAISPIWLRIADDGTNRICSWWRNGQNFHQFDSVGRSDFLTADEIGFYAQSNNSTYPAGITLLSWVT